MQFFTIQEYRFGHVFILHSLGQTKYHNGFSPASASNQIRTRSAIVEKTPSINPAVKGLVDI